MKVTSPDGRTWSVTRRWMPWRRRIKNGGDTGGGWDLPSGVLDAADDGLGLVLLVVGLALAAIVALPLLLLTLGAALEVALLIALLPLWAVLRTCFGVPWEVEVRESSAPSLVWPVIHTEQHRGWRESGSRIADLTEEIRRGAFVPTRPAFQVTLTRDSVCMGDDTTDNTRILEIAPRHDSADPTLGDLLSALVEGGPFVSVSGGPTTWLLRDGRGGRPMAVLQLHTGDDRRLRARPVVDPSVRIAAAGVLHLDYLLQDDVDLVVARVAADPRRRGPYRVT